MVQTQQDLNNSLTQLITDIGTLTSAVDVNSTAIQALLAKIASGATDLTNEVNRVTQADQAVKDAAAKIASDDASAA